MTAARSILILAGALAVGAIALAANFAHRAGLPAGWLLPAALMLTYLAGLGLGRLVWTAKGRRDG